MTENRVTLISLLSEIVSEVGDLERIKSFKWTKEDEFTYTFQLEENVGGRVKFSDIKNFVVAGSFDLPETVDFDKIEHYAGVGYEIMGVESQYKKSDYATLIKVLKTVSEIVGNFLKAHPETLLAVFESDKDTGEISYKQKSLLYKNIISKNLPSKYRMANASYIKEKIPGFIIFPK